MSEHNDPIDAEHLSRTIGAIYDAALEPALWPSALELIRDFCDAKAATLVSHDVLDRNPHWGHTIGYAPEWMARYREGYLEMNPTLPVIAEMACGECDYGSRHAFYRAVRDTPLYTEWLQPQDLYDGAMVVVDKTPTTVATLVVIKAESTGLYDDSIRERLLLLFPHVRRATLIERTLRELELTVQDAAAMLDALPSGVLTVAADGTLVSANRAAQKMIAADGPMMGVAGRLEFTGNNAQRAFARALEAAKRGDVAAGEMGVSIPVEDGRGRAYHVHILPLDARRRAVLTAQAPAVIGVFVRRSTTSYAEAVAALAQRYGLTAREHDVLLAMVDVGGIPMIADLLGISQTTVRTHVTNIFDKTGVRRQGDLIRLVAEAATNSMP